MQNIKKARLNSLIVALAYFISIPISNIVLVFKPLYNKVYYGQSNDIFYYVLSMIVLALFMILIELCLKKKLNVLYEKKKEISYRNTIIVFLITFITIFIISAIIRFHVKPFYDLGNNTTGFSIIIKAVEILYLIMLAAYVVKIIESFQYALDDIIPFKNPNINKYFPYGGICAMLTFGVYALIMGIFTLPVLFFFLILLYGEIYLLAERSFLKSFASILLIMVF